MRTWASLAALLIPASMLLAQTPGSATATTHSPAHFVVHVTKMSLQAEQGTPTAFRGHVTPPDPHGAIDLQMRSHGGWTTVIPGRLSGHSTFDLGVGNWTAGRYLYRVVKPGNSRYATGRSKVLHLAVRAKITPLVFPAMTLPDGQQGRPYDAPVEADGGYVPYSWSLIASTHLAAGLTLSKSGIITGTPTTDGSDPLDFKVTDAHGKHLSRRITLFIAGPDHTWRAEAAPSPSGDSAGVPTLASLACPGVGDCVAVGEDANTTSPEQTVSTPLIETLSAGQWTAEEAPLPSGEASPDNGNLWGVSCTSTSSCVAVGSYSDSSHNQQPLAESFVAGVWVASVLPLPSDADTRPNSQDAQLDSVDCPSAGSCVAVGVYTNTDGFGEPLFETLDAGTWRASTTSSGGGGLSTVSCNSTSECLATGGMLARLTGSTWSTATAPGVTASADDGNLGQTACPTSTTCFATQTLSAAPGDTTFSAELDTSTATDLSAAAVPIPADGVSAGLHTTLDAIDCPTSTWCLATGAYTDGNDQSQLLVDELNDGKWSTTAGRIPTADSVAANPPDGSGGVLLAASCATAGACTAVGSDEWGDAEPLAASLQVGRWSVQELPLPSAPTPASGPWSLSQVQCPSAAACVAIGTFRNSVGTTEAFIETETT